MSGALIEDPVLKQSYTFTETTNAGGEPVMMVEAWVEPGGGVTPHVHPGMKETFRVESGECSFLSGREWITAGVGEEAVIPAGTRHAYRNNGDVTAHIICEAKPPQSLAGFLTDAAAINRAGLLTEKAFPKSLKGAIQAAVLAEEHKDMVTLLWPPAPPKFLQRLLFPAIARIGARRGYGPGAMG